jgi:formylglycine-generating enzyme required for sulfatase activity
VTWLVAQPVDQVGQWLAGLGPISRHLVGALDDAFRAAASEGGQEIAAYALAHVLEENGRWEQILALVKEARPYQLPALVSILEQHGDEAVALLEDACRAGSTEVRSNLVVALVSLGRADAALPHLRHTADPTLRSYLIQNLAAARVPLRMFREYLLDGSLDADVRQALILAVGNYPQSSLGPMERERIGNTLREIYSQHADIGIHSAAEWVLRQFDFELPAIDRPATLTPRHRDWFVTPSGSTLAVLEIPEHYQPTAAAKTPARHRFAISTKEVTVQEFAKFLPQHRVDFRARHDPTCPAHMMDWYTAAAYCNWLNEREGIPEDQWCYAPNENGEYAAGMTIAADFLRRSGYRLPLSAEWLYAASGEAKTRFFFGTDADLLTDYAWLAMNSQGVQHAVGSLRPNRFGLFDVYGSVKEWAHSLESEGPQDLLATDDNQRSVLGGCFVHFATQFQANYAKHGNPPELREYLNGFRVARTILSPRAD